jgi:hypothetical protein
MVLFIRNKDNHSIVDTEVWIKKEDDKEFIELKSVVDINYYSHFLLENPKRSDEIIEDFSALQELRGWLWESYFLGGDNDPKEYDNVISFLQERFRNIAKKYNLDFVVD